MDETRPSEINEDKTREVFIQGEEGVVTVGSEGAVTVGIWGPHPGTW
jgi:hypothetical protein